MTRRPRSRGRGVSRTTPASARASSRRRNSGVDMKMKLAAAAALGFVITAGLAAKGTTVKLVVSQGDLRAPIEITKDVQFASPWGDAFVHAWIAIPAPPA